MSGIGQVRQFSAADVTRALLDSPSKLVIAAAGCMLLFLFLPTLYVSGTATGIAAGGFSLDGAQLAGGAAWLTLLLFTLAAASRFLPPLAPYRSLLDQAAFATVGIAILYVALASPVASGMRQIGEARGVVGGMFGNIGAPAAAPLACVSVVPHVGALLFLAAPVGLFLARRRERAAA